LEKDLRGAAEEGGRYGLKYRGRVSPKGRRRKNRTTRISKITGGAK